VRGIHERFAKNKGLWPSYVAAHLLPRLYGFELLMVPCAVVHMKLGIQLKESGYDFGADERLCYSGECEALTRKVIEKIAMDRLLPPIKSRPIQFKLPKLDTVSNALSA
jgi:hypothetical protein